jgi:peptidyl-prolyl cis-trans isomerase A (cyclophilin A)
MNKKLFPLIAAAAFVLAACDKNDKPSGAPESAAPAAAPAQTMPAAAANPALLSPEKANEKAPEVFKVRFSTTKGDMVIEAHRAWSPNGADRFYNLVKIGYFDDTRFFRVLNGFMAQIGIHGDPAVNEKWHASTIKDDPLVGQSNKPGYVTFAKTGNPDSRSTQIFFNFGDNGALDGQGFTPFGRVIDQGAIQTQGNAYLNGNFPKLDYVKTARIIP